MSDEIEDCLKRVIHAVKMPSTSLHRTHLLFAPFRQVVKVDYIWILEYPLNKAIKSSVDSFPALSVPASRLSAKSRLVLWRATIFSSIVPLVLKRYTFTGRC